MMNSGMVKDPEDQKRFISMIGVEVDRLIELINDVLKISELESVVMPQPDDRSDVLAVAQECKTALEPMARDGRITVSISGDDAQVAMAPGRLRELLTNLMENGIKYNEPGGRVDVAVQRKGDRVAITVKDPGIGIPKESQERVYERFYRVTRAAPARPAAPAWAWPSSSTSFSSTAAPSPWRAPPARGLPLP